MTASRLSVTAPEMGEPIKLKLFSSPLVNGDGKVVNTDDEEDDATVKEFIPQLRRHDEPTLLEIFYDLFFAATYNVFCEIKEVTSASTFKASIGFFCLLWLTWLAVTLFEVRYATDSIFSRVATAVQLGVLVGFVIVAPNFSPSEAPTAETPRAMQAMSIILAISRACLVAQYSWILFHLRKHKACILPLALQITVHGVSAIVLLGVSFVFLRSPPSHTYMIWYFITGADAVLTVGISHMGGDTIALNSTHLMKRMALLTVMILGEGIESMAKKVIQIMSSPSLLSKAIGTVTRGHITAVASTIYFIFLVYFDWLGPNFYLPRVRQSIWIALHLPFHLALVLFTQGFVQLLTWSTVVSNVNKLYDNVFPVTNFVEAGATSEQIAGAMNDKINKFFDVFPAQDLKTLAVTEKAIEEIKAIPNELWAPLLQYLSGPETDPPEEVKKWYPDLITTSLTIASTLSNTIFQTFDIALEDAGTISDPSAGDADELAREFQFEELLHDWERYRTVYLTIFIAGGLMILFMLSLKCISSRIPKTFWSGLRLASVIITGIAMCLISLVWKSAASEIPDFVLGAWVAPTVALLWTFLVILTHIDFSAARKLNLNMLKYKKIGDSKQKDTRGDVWPTPPPVKDGHESFAGSTVFYNTSPPPPAFYADNTAAAVAPAAPAPYEGPQPGISMPYAPDTTYGLSTETYGAYSSAYSPGSTLYNAQYNDQPGASTAYTGYSPGPGHV